MGESLVCVAALIFDTDDRLFLVRRAADLALFANCWDVVGGHVEPGESVAGALRREVYEETAWRIGTVLDELPPWTWTGDDGLTRTEYDFLVAIDSDLARAASSSSTRSTSCTNGCSANGGRGWTRPWRAHRRSSGGCSMRRRTPVAMRSPRWRRRTRVGSGGTRYC